MIPSSSIFFMKRHEYIEGQQAIENFEQGMKALLKVPKKTHGQTEIVLHSFDGQGGDGSRPFLVTLVLDKSGHLFGFATSLKEAPIILGVGARCLRLLHRARRRFFTPLTRVAMGAIPSPL